MKILKLVVIDFDKELELKGFKKKRGDSVIRYHDTYETPFGKQVIFSGEQSNIEYNCINENIHVSDLLINALTKDLEDTVNIISLSNNCGNKINSCQPSLFLESQSETDSNHLKTVSKFSFDSPVSIAQVNVNHIFDFDLCFNQLDDRLDGIKIFSEALSTKSTSGKFREYFRFFERAFKRENRGLTKPLTTFLLQNKKLEYEEREVENWISTRHRLNHANSKEGFLINRNLIDLMPRIEQAAIEVLFNKTTWNDKSINRRNLFEFKKGINKNNSGFVKPKSTESITLMLFDENKTFPVNLFARFNPKDIPGEWWYEGTGKYEIKDMLVIKN